MRLVAAGFVMKEEGNKIWGQTGAEKFDFTPHKILSEPTRDVFVGEFGKGWFVTSYINFSAKRIHSDIEHQASILNIFGSAPTLEEAVTNFLYNFEHKCYMGMPQGQSVGVQIKEEGTASLSPRIVT